MAVEDKYVNSDIVAGTLTVAAFGQGDKVVCFKEIVTIAAADDNLSVYRILKDVNPHLIPYEIRIWTPSTITAGTDYDLGFYETLNDGVGGAVIDKAALLAGADLSSAILRSAALDGLLAVTAANSQKRIFELAGHTLDTRKTGYDLALTGNVVGSAAGTIIVEGVFIQG